MKALKNLRIIITLIAFVFVLTACESDTNNIHSVDAIDDLTVPQFTSFDDLDLPSSVIVELDNGEEKTLRVSWDQARGRYANDQIGQYDLTGDLITTGDLTNRDNLNVEITVEIYAEDVMETLKASGEYTLFIDAIIAADLDNTFKEHEALTVFAPTDEAFNNLLNTFELSESDLLEVEWLEQVILYHALENTRSKSALEGFSPMALTTLQGEDIQFASSSDRLTLNGNVFINNDEYRASNGVIIGVNNVLLPSDVLSSVATDLIPEDLMNLLFDLIASGDIPIDLLPLPSGGDFEIGFTLFAPSETALRTLAESLDISLETLVETDAFIEIITYHVILDSYLLSELYESSPIELETLQGENLTFTVDNDTLTVNGTAITASESLMDFGYVHMIDDILIPPSLIDNWPDVIDE